jgi:feruloyl esterase
LAAIAPPGVRILSADVVEQGKFEAPPGSSIPPELGRRIATLPAFCRVTVEARPVVASKIGIELWLPLEHWNGRFLGTGNGGSAGAIAYGGGMVEGLKRGFAVANTDMGMTPDIEDPRKFAGLWADFGHRSTHEMTRVGQALTRAFYGIASFRSYFQGCSTGGQQALSEAQRYPDDYDGILAGAPGSNRTHGTAFFIWNYQAMNALPASKLSAGQWALVTQSVLAACAGKDGGAPGDRFLTDPRRCRFDVATLPRCAADTGASGCFTQAQLEALSRLYAGAVNPRSGERIYPGLTPGSESLPIGPMRMNQPDILSRLFVMRWGMGADFPAMQFDFDRDVDRLDARLSSTLNANDSDLSEFVRRGGKLMLYNGLADAGVPYADTLGYYERVVAALGERQSSDSVRLFLAPGMGHCNGGPGPSDFGQTSSPSIPAERSADALMTLVAWTEGSPPPDQLLARTYNEDGAPVLERPLCAYPAFPEYVGGDRDKRSSFVCRAHERGAQQLPSPRYIN